MAVNFFDSAGSDLDNLFSANNSNAGALGYLTSGNQDLGNRYIKGSLNRTIGYYNSAGTDIGYSRGKIVAPTATTSIAVQHYSDQGNCTYDGGRYHYCNHCKTVCDSNGESCSTSCKQFGRGLLTLTINITNNVPITSIDWYLIIQDRHSDLGSNRPWTFYWNVNSTNVPTYPSYSSGVQNYSSTTYLNFDYENHWLDTNKLITTSNTTLKIGYCIPKSLEISWWGFWAKSKAYIKNSAGGLWVQSTNYVKLAGYHNT